MASNAFKFVDDVREIVPEAQLTKPTIEGDVVAVPSAAELPPVNQWQRPAAYFERRMFTDGSLNMPDGEAVRFWGFEDPRAPSKTLPSPVIRVREGETVQIRLEIEKDAPKTVARSRNGSSAALKSASYVYQWQPKSAGTWLYQSHESSLKHFEMGLFGLLIVDPEPAENGKPRAYSGGPEYDVERCFVLDDVDPAWHGQAPGSGNGGSVTSGAPEFNPKYFLVNGVANTEALEHPAVSIDAKPGDKVLLRLLNASFSLVRMKIEKLRAEIVSVDGKPLAGAARPWSKWSPVNAGQSVYMATGARHDMLVDLDPARNSVAPGDEFLVTFEYLDAAKRQVRNSDASSPLYVGRAVTKIRIV